VPLKSPGLRKRTNNFASSCNRIESEDGSERGFSFPCLNRLQKTLYLMEDSDISKCGTEVDEDGGFDTYTDVRVACTKWLRERGLIYDRYRTFTKDFSNEEKHSLGIEA
jgi:hypothetical protein